MLELLLQRFRPAGSWLRRLRWGLGGGAAILILGIAFGLNARGPREYVSSALLKIEFVRPDGVRLSLERYATNVLGWPVIQAEARLLCSDLVLRKAYERLEADSNGSTNGTGSVLTPGPRGRRPQWRLASAGIRIRAFGTDAKQSAGLLNAIAKVYRDERNAVAPAPPGCKAVVVGTPEPAPPGTRFLPMAHYFRLAFAATLLGFAVAVLRARKPPGTRLPFVALFVSWFSGLSGIALFIPPFDAAVGLAGAILLGYLMAAGDGCITFVAPPQSPVSARLLRYILVCACLLFVGFGILFGLSNSVSRARVKVSIQDPATAGELGASYAPNFMATEVALIQSSTIATSLVERYDLKRDLSKKYGVAFKTANAVAVASGRISAKAVKGSNLVDICFWGDAPNENGIWARRVAEVYRDYWQQRSTTNLERRITVTLLNWSSAPGEEKRIAVALGGTVVARMVIESLYVLVGALCVAWLGKKPIQLHFLAAIVSGYLMLLLVLFLGSAVGTDIYAATCQIRIWPPLTMLQQWPARLPGESSGMLLARECLAASSEQVRGEVVKGLEANPDFLKRQGGGWEQSSRVEKQNWLKRRLKVIAVEDAMLLRFVASVENPEDAAEIANSSASAYLLLRKRALDEAAAGWLRVDAEVLESAVVSKQPVNSSGPLEAGLTAGLGCIGWMLLGAGIAFVGIVVQKARSAARATSPQSTPDRDPRPWRKW